VLNNKKIEQDREHKVMKHHFARESIARGTDVVEKPVFDLDYWKHRHGRDHLLDVQYLKEGVLIRAPLGAKKNEVDVGYLLAHAKNEGLFSSYGIKKMETRLGAMLGLAPEHITAAFKDHPEELAVHYFLAMPDDEPPGPILRAVARFNLAASASAFIGGSSLLYYLTSNYSNYQMEQNLLLKLLAVPSVFGALLGGVFSIGNISPAFRRYKIDPDYIEHVREALKAFVIKGNKKLGITEIIEVPPELPASIIARDKQKAYEAMMRTAYENEMRAQEEDRRKAAATVAKQLEKLGEEELENAIQAAQRQAHIDFDKAVAPHPHLIQRLSSYLKHFFWPAHEETPPMFTSEQIEAALAQLRSSSPPPLRAERNAPATNDDRPPMREVA
jgi:hypothetical protein